MIVANKLLYVSECRHGKGVFASGHLRRRQRLLGFHGPSVSLHEIPSPADGGHDFYLQVGRDLFIGPSGDIDDCVNHSCNPNCGLRIADDCIDLIAVRNISPGEELCFDYSTTMLDFPFRMNCTCGEPNCRLTITDFRFLPKPLQGLYISSGVVPQYVLDDMPVRRLSASFIKCGLSKPVTPSIVGGER